MSFEAYYALTISAAVLAAASILFARSFPSIIRTERKENLYYPIAILIIAAMIVSFFPKYFFIYCDDWYIIEYAKNIIGWEISALKEPYILGISMPYVIPLFLIGISEKAVFLITSAINIFTALIFYLFVRNLFGPKAAFIASTIFVFSEGYYMWSASTYSPLLVFSIALSSAYMMQIYLKTNDRNCLYSSLFLFGYIPLMQRPDIAAIGILIFGSYSLKKGLSLRSIRPWIIPLVIFMMIIPISMNWYDSWSYHESRPRPYSFNPENMIMNIIQIPEALKLDSDPLSLKYLLPDNIFRYAYPILMGILFLSGVIVAFRKHRVAAMLLSASGAAFLLFHLNMEPSYFIYQRLYFFIAIIFMMVAIALAASTEVYKGRTRAIVTVAILGYITIAGGFFTASAIQEYRYNQDINVLHFNTILPSYIERNYPDCTIVTNHPSRYTATTDLYAVSYDRYSYDGSCAIYIEDISSYYGTEESRRTDSFKRNHILEIIGYVNQESVRTLDPDLKIEYAIFQIKGNISGES